MKSIAQIVQNNRRLLAAYEDKVQPRFLSRYAREPMDAAVEKLGARTEFHVADVLAPLAGEPGRTDEIWVCGALHQMKDAGAALGRVAGLLADRFGRRRTLLVVTAGIMVYGALFAPMLGSGNTSAGTMLLFLIIGMTLMGLTFGPMSAVLPELFPTNVRYTGSGISYNVSSILGAAVAPFIATWLATSFGVAWVGLYLFIAASLTFVAILVMRETRDASLDSADRADLAR